jgi:PAS domain S-box-containing protein
MRRQTPDARNAVFSAGDPLVTCGADLRITGWNRAAEDLTGVPAAEALGRPCWEVMDGVDEDGRRVCRPGCPYGWLARQEHPTGRHDVLIRARGGRRRVTLHSISARVSGRLAILHLIHVPPPPRPGDQPDPSGAGETEQAPAPRQRQVLALLGDELPTSTIAGRLGVAEATVRGHVRGILAALHCRSRREAVAEARRMGIV